MRLDLTKLDVQLLVDALAQPAGVSKSFRKQAEELRDRLRYQLCAPPPPRSFTPIRSAFPDNHTKPDKRTDWSFHKPRQPKAVRVNNSTPPKTSTVDKLLEGLL